MIDRLTAEVAGAFDDAGIDFLVMKGPVIASWLYPAEVRPYASAYVTKSRDADDLVGTIAAVAGGENFILAL
jgi:hypothetical protein